MRYEAGPPARVRAVGGNGQSATVGTALPRRVVVQVTDDGGNPVSGTEVRFEVVVGGGTVFPSRAVTDSLGIASSRWRLGQPAGSQSVVALVPNAQDALLTFNAVGLAIVEPEPEPEEEEEAVEPPPTTLIVRTDFYSVGGSLVCTLRSGSASCRGADDRGQRGNGVSLGLRAIAAGVSHVCGLGQDGAAYCWGANDSGQLGDASRTDRSQPQTVATDLRFSTLAAGLSHTCGLVADGQVACWGRNLNGQLGDGSRQDRAVPQLSAGGVRFRTLTAGWNHTCGLTDTNEVYCWGLNSEGQIGDGSRLDRLEPTRVAASFSALSAGSGHTCGVSFGQVRCWGDNAFGQLGDGSTSDRANPVVVTGLEGSARSVAAGAVHTCALVQGGSTFCWGQNLSGQLGVGTTQNRSTPTAIAGSVRFTRVEAGGALTCGFATDGFEYCWGLNQSGQIGDGSRTNRSSPVRVTGG